MLKKTILCYICNTNFTLKKLLVGGYERVYEIGRIFRNEGVGATHNLEFTSIEFYEAYSDLWGMMDRIKKLFAYITKKLNINSVVFNGQKIEFKYPFNKINMVDELNKKLNIDLRKFSDKEAIKFASQMPDIYYYEFEVITQNNEIKKFNKLDYFLNVVKNDTNNFVFAKYSEK